MRIALNPVQRLLRFAIVEDAGEFRGFDVIPRGLRHRPNLVNLAREQRHPACLSRVLARFLRVFLSPIVGLDNMQTPFISFQQDGVRGATVIEFRAFRLLVVGIQARVRVPSVQRGLAHEQMRDGCRKRRDAIGIGALALASPPCGGVGTQTRSSRFSRSRSRLLRWSSAEPRPLRASCIGEIGNG